MKTAFAKFAAIISIAFSVQPTFCLAVDEDATRINKLIAYSATQLNVGTVSLNWFEQPEVKKLRALRDIKRTAAMQADDYKAAPEMFMRDLVRDQYNHEFHFWAARAFAHLGDKAQSRRHLTVAMNCSTTGREHELYAAVTQQPIR